MKRDPDFERFVRSYQKAPGWKRAVFFTLMQLAAIPGRWGRFCKRWAVRAVKRG